MDWAGYLEKSESVAGAAVASAPTAGAERPTAADRVTAEKVRPVGSNTFPPTARRPEKRQPPAAETNREKQSNQLRLTLCQILNVIYVRIRNN